MAGGKGEVEARRWRTRIFERVRLVDATRMERVVTIEVDLSRYPLLPEWREKGTGLMPVPLLDTWEQQPKGQDNPERYAERYEIVDEAGRLVPSVRISRPNLLGVRGLSGGSTGTDLCALVDPDGAAHRVFAVTTWGPVADRGRSFAARSEAYITLRGLLEANYYEFEIVVPPGIRLGKAVPEFERAEPGGSIFTTRQGEWMASRSAPDGTALYFALSPCEETSGKAWFNVIPDLLRSWVLVPLLPFVACLFLALGAKEVVSGDPGSFVTTLLLAIPVIAAVVTSIGAAQLANRFFPLVRRVAVASYLVIVAQSLVIAFKPPAHVMLEWSWALAIVAGVLSAVNAFAYLRARSRDPR